MNYWGINMKKKQNVLFIAVILLIAAVLRAPITGVGSIVGLIREDLHLSNGVAGFLTTIPLLTFAVVSVLVGRFQNRLGAGKIMLYGLLLLFFGILCRSYIGSTGLFLGTVLIGVGLAIGNVLIPAFIKARFPDKVGPMTSLYTTIMSAFAGISGGISVPVAYAIGWKNALAIWLLLVTLALVMWLPHRKLSIGNKANSTGKAAASHSTIFKSGATWYITFYMGIQSFMFYCFVAWLATILQGRGFDTQTSGYFSSLYMLLGIPGSFLIPLIAGKTKSQSKIGVGLGLIYIIGMISMLFTHSTPLLLVAIVCCGFCSGACISFSMALFGLHTTNASDASTLSGLAQSVGYLLAAVGPTLIGKLYDVTKSFRYPLILLLVMAVILTLLGYLAGRDRMIGKTE